VGSITRLYPAIELYSDGGLPNNALFVLGRSTAALSEQDELLVVDPPSDLSEHFVAPERVAGVTTDGAPVSAGIRALDVKAGDVAHIRIGDHFVDVHGFAGGAVVHLPMVGIVCGGDCASSTLVPRLAVGSDGTDELERLRLIARLVRERRIHVYVPRTGELISDGVQLMERLAADVGYVHGLRRVIPALRERGETVGGALEIGETLLPDSRTSVSARSVHEANVRMLHGSTVSTGDVA
jgi:hypothetical protein